MEASGKADCRYNVESLLLKVDESLTQLLPLLADFVREPNHSLSMAQ
jgi:hypothetical protein